ncbi:MAG: hypothetical protein AAF403_08835, partial [Pseudomonadota bacterium]
MFYNKFNGSDLTVSDHLNHVSVNVNNHKLTLSGPAKLSSDGFASLRINDRTFVVAMKKDSTLEDARDALVKDINQRGLSASSLGTNQIAIALPATETLKGAFHFITSNDPLVTHYQYDALLDQSGHAFKIRGSNIMGGSGSDHLTGTSNGDFLAGGKDDGHTTISWKNVHGADKDTVIGIYRIDPNDPNRRIGQVIYGSKDDLGTNTNFVPFGGGGAIVEEQYFVISKAANSGLSAGDSIHLSQNAAGKWEAYKAGHQVASVGDINLLDDQTAQGAGKPKIINSAGVIDIDLNGNGVSDLRYRASATISDKSDVLSGGAGSDVFFFRKGDGVDKITDFDVSKDGDVLVLSGYKTSDLSFSVNEQGKAV